MFSLTFEGLVFPITLNMSDISITRYRKYVEHKKKLREGLKEHFFLPVMKNIFLRQIGCPSVC